MPAIVPAVTRETGTAAPGGGRNRVALDAGHSFAMDLGREHRAKPLPPEPHRLVADLDAEVGLISKTFTSEALALKARAILDW